MIYLDTGCLVKLYYPELESQKVAAFVRGKPVCFNPLHQLEFTNALHLKLYHQTATSAQVQAASGLVETDLKSGVLLPAVANWEKIFRVAAELARQHSGLIGCRSLDVLHCAAATVMEASEFLSTDARQRRLAATMGLKLGIL